MTFKCIHCGNTVANNTFTTKDFNIDGKVFVVQNIPTNECSNCHEKFFDKAANEYIDSQLPPIEESL